MRKNLAPATPSECALWENEANEAIIDTCVLVTRIEIVRCLQRHALGYSQCQDNKIVK